MTEDSPATVNRILSAYEIGRKLRQLRLRKKIALIDLGKHTGLSASMLSQLENGKLVPTLATLARISMVFDVGLEHFFGNRRGQKTFAIVRAGERLRFPERADSPAPALAGTFPYSRRQWQTFPRNRIQVNAKDGCCTDARTEA